MARNPVVSGQFYPGDKETLLKELGGMIPDCSEKINAVGAIVPHAGYVYSGYVAGEVYAKLKPKTTYIILGPNHTGYGERFASCAESWSTPLGPVDVDKDLLAEMMRETGLIVEDSSAHAFEHSIEVQLPFIQKTSPEASIVPITVQYGNLSEYQELALAITSAIKKKNRDAIIIASSDMTHYESRKVAKEKDKKAIQAVLDLDAEKLLNVVEKNNISMCGYIPAGIMLMCAKSMGAKKAELVKYSDSGEMTGDTLQVVGYAGMIVY
ncbi:MAG: AmmeMemoRadiSam system protein B [Candidatus Omnitrophota bacterium]